MTMVAHGHEIFQRLVTDIRVRQMMRRFVRAMTTLTI